MEALADAVDRLVEIEAIHRLKARYFRTLDMRDWAGWRSCFTDDLEAVFDGSGPMPPGADAFVALIAATLRGATTVHHGHTPEIALTGPESATGIWAMIDLLRIPGQPDMRGLGHYHEHYRKGADGAWRIERIHVTRLRIDRSPPNGGPASNHERRG